MSSRFQIQPSANISRSVFDCSHGHKTTFDAGWLIPIYVDEALPGDTFSLRANMFARMGSPLQYPVMDNMFLETFFFEVPVRQIWDNWQKFNGEQDNPGDSTDYLIPTMTAPAGSGYAEGTIYDHMGIPTGVPGLEHSALPLRAAAHIWNEWFRDENLQDKIDVRTDDGPDPEGHYSLFRRGKRHDYFTSCLPWPQKSDSGSVELPLGDRATVYHDRNDGDNIIVGSTVNSEFRNLTSSTPTLTAGTGNGSEENALYADLSSATAATINQLRQSIAIQRLFERDARGGTRYIEVIKNHWNVDSPDLRLQRPGLMGTGRSPININAVTQTNQLDDVVAPGNSPIGRQSAHVTVGASDHGFKRSFTEHTIIIGFANVRADLTYQQGLNRMWSRRTRFDFYWPELATIGEQEVKNKEIYAQGPAVVDGSSNVVDELAFGYQERYAEYRYKPSLITGQFRSQAATPLDTWHLSQDFANLPVLGDQFIQDDPPIDRVVAVPSEPHFIFDSYMQLSCVRAMPMYGIPGLDKL